MGTSGYVDLIQTSISVHTFNAMTVDDLKQALRLKKKQLFEDEKRQRAFAREQRRIAIQNMREVMDAYCHEHFGVGLMTIAMDYRPQS